MPQASAFAYPKSHRLLNASDYSGVFKGAELNISRGPLRLRAIRNRMPRARIGVVVSKRGNRTAVRRNRIKRIVRERFRLAGTDLPSVDIALQVFGQIDDRKLVSHVDELFRKLQQRFGDDEQP